MAKKGRPTEYTEKIAEEICKRLSEGETLRSICRDEHMPHESTVRHWAVVDYESFFTQYARARDVGLDAMADEIIEIADKPQMGERTKIDKDGEKEITKGDMVERSKLKVDTRKWYLSKLAPKKYGDIKQLRHADAHGNNLIGDAIAAVTGRTTDIPSADGESGE